MSSIHKTGFLACCAILIGIGTAAAQTAAAQSTAAQPAAAQTGADSRTASTTSAPVTAPAPGGPQEGAQATGSLVLLFGSGSSALGPRNEALLDQASRLYREGRPIIMIVSGGADAVGSPERNLILSQQRANAAFRGMVARGIPAERCQILAKGETNPALPTPRGVPEPQNRRVEITWR